MKNDYVGCLPPCHVLSICDELNFTNKRHGQLTPPNSDKPAKSLVPLVKGEWGELAPRDAVPVALPG